MNARWLTPHRSKALARAALFIAGFLLLAVIADRAVGWYTERTQGRHLIGHEVYAVQQRLKQTDPAVRAVYLGDSVSRQLFVPGEEPAPEIKYLTSNQAISLAGQYYLLRGAIEHYPSLEEVLLFYSAGSWRNDLDQVYTHDYFCGYFHEPEQVAELFAVKHDWELLSAHLGRALLPNLTALNSTMGAGHPKPRATAEAQEAMIPRPAIEALIVPSRISDEFLKRIRALCAAHGLTLRILPCPAPDCVRFADARGLYDRPIVYLPSRLFRSDGVHVLDASVSEVRAAVEQGLGLRHAESARAPQRAQTTGVSGEEPPSIATSTGSGLSAQ